ncbi:MAG: protein-glutamate O-methyltransferase CheR [bacterium]
MTALTSIAALLRQRLGLDASALGPRTLGHVVRRRVKARGLEGAAPYAALLPDDPAEWQALIEAVVVPETWFFRDREPFSLLGHWATQARRPHSRLELLSLPCASGEEAWSMAIALAAAGLPVDAFHVEARDVSERALAVARGGVYAKRALRSAPIDPAWLPYLRALPDGGLEVDPGLRASVTFAVGNLIDMPGAVGERRFDCIFSRNLLIYCDAETRSAALAGFAAVLRPDGLLILGHADPMPPGTPGFVRTGPAAAFAWRRAAAPLRAVRKRPALAASRRSAPDKPAPPAQRPEEPLLLARQLADRGRLPEAAALATAQLASAPVDAEALTLLGIVRAAQGRDAEAAEHLRRALAVEPSREEALLHLALVVERGGDQIGAARLRARARKR